MSDKRRDDDTSDDALKSGEMAAEELHRAKKKAIRKYYAVKFHREYQKLKGNNRRIRTKVLLKLKEIAAAEGASFMITAATAALIIFITVSVGSCAAVVPSGLGMITSSSFQSRPEDIDAAELQMTELEMELQEQIDNISEEYPGYDEYEYRIDQIGHDPIALIAYLSAKKPAFTASRTEDDINTLYRDMYELSLEEREETRTRTVEKTGIRDIYDEITGEKTGEEEYEYEEEEEYTVRILDVTLKTKDMKDLVDADLNEEEKELRDLLMKTGGLLQYYYSPLELNWQSYIRSYYGYRKNPKTGELEFNRGVDISVPEGTPVHAAQDGSVTVTDHDPDYGNYVVIEDEKSYASIYGHLSRITVHKGQEVSHGEVIGYTGHTGSAAGSELHIECSYRGESYNPVFYFENGEGSIYETDPDTGEIIPVEASGDAKALIDEAMKHLDLPYKWGGYSPVSGFDCSGFVSWCINKSGYADVGRLTAQGLCNISQRVSAEDAKPGDLVFFTGTYNSGCPVSHVGIYLGNGKMIHAGDPVKISDINTPYWQGHFYRFARL